MITKEELLAKYNNQNSIEANLVLALTDNMLRESMVIDPSEANSLDSRIPIKNKEEYILQYQKIFYKINWQTKREDPNIEYHLTLIPKDHTVLLILIIKSEDQMLGIGVGPTENGSIKECFEINYQELKNSPEMVERLTSDTLSIRDISLYWVQYYLHIHKKSESLSQLAQAIMMANMI